MSEGNDGRRSATALLKTQNRYCVHQWCLQRRRFGEPLHHDRCQNRGFKSRTVGDYLQVLDGQRFTEWDLRGLATNIICSSGDLRREAVCQSSISPSAIFVFPRKSSRFNHFPDRANWLLLAPKTPFWQVTGTIVGTAGT